MVSNGHVRCPWHGACFNIRTGDIEDFPGLDSVQKFDVSIIVFIIMVWHSRRISPFLEETVSSILNIVIFPLVVQVCVEGGQVKVRADKKALETKKRIKAMCCSNPEEDKTYLIVGGGKY